jgi:hypothetical protein
MIQVLLKSFKIMCGLPAASFTGSLIIPLINPILLISSFIPILLCIMFIGNPNILNSRDNQTKEWTKSAQTGFAIYYIIFFLLSFCILSTTCDSLPF